MGYCSVCKQWHDDDTDECPNYYLKEFEEAVEKCKPIFTNKEE